MTTTLPKVTVLMATFNGAGHIEDQVRSILDQRGVDLRLLIRDDGSSDATPKLIADMAAACPDRIMVVTDGAGPSGSAAANFGVMLLSRDVAPDEWTALADQDDIWFPDKMICAISHMLAENADGYSSNLIAFDDNANAAWQVRKDAPQTTFDYLFQGASAGCTYVLSARAVDVVQKGIGRIGGKIPTHASHDWLIYALCRSAGLRWALDRRSRIAYRQHSTNVYGTKLGLAKVIERAGRLRSRWYRRNILWLRTALDTTPAEQQVLERVARLAPHDRWWLARNASVLRRDRQEARQLSLALLTGLF